MALDLPGNSRDPLAAQLHVVVRAENKDSAQEKLMRLAVKVDSAVFSQEPVPGIHLFGLANQRD